MPNLDLVQLLDAAHTIGYTQKGFSQTDDLIFDAVGNGRGGSRSSTAVESWLREE